MKIYQPTHSKINRSYYWCIVEEDGSLTFGFDDGNTDKQVLSKNSYNNIDKYIDEATEKLEYHNKIHPKYYESIKSNYMSKENKLFKWAIFEVRRK